MQVTSYRPVRIHLIINIFDNLCVLYRVSRCVYITYRALFTYEMCPCWDWDIGWWYE